jgi:hypothetical protein
MWLLPPAIWSSRHHALVTAGSLLGDVLLLDKKPAQDLARGGLGDLVNELDTTDPLVWRNPLGKPANQLVGGCATAKDNECLRYLASYLIRAPYDGCISYRWMGQQNTLQLGGGDLEALVLDQLLQAVDDEELVVIVDMPDVAGVEEPISVDRVPRT